MYFSSSGKSRRPLSRKSRPASDIFKLYPMAANARQKAQGTALRQSFS
jgi:hypothetical protein